MKQVIKKGDYVVCTLKERPDYFNEDGEMDRYLDEKELILVNDSFKSHIKTEEYWLIHNEDLKLIWSKPANDTYIVKQAWLGYRVYDTEFDEFVSMPLSLDDAQKVADIYNKSLNDNKLNKKEGKQ